MARIEISQQLETGWETLLGLMRMDWLRHGSLRLHEQVRQTLGTKLEVSAGPFDLGLSARLAVKSVPDACYWNAARALLVAREVTGAVYVEGLVCQHWTFKDTVRSAAIGRASIPYVNVDWQGWLELYGRVVDPTSLLFFELLPTRPQALTSILETSIYLPLARFDRSEVGDRWEELPLSLSDRAAFDATVAATDAVFAAYCGALLSARRGGLPCK